MKKERLEKLAKEYLETRNNIEAIESFTKAHTDKEMAEIRKYVVENFADSRMIEALSNAGMTVRTYVESQEEIIEAESMRPEIEAVKEELTIQNIIDYQNELSYSGYKTIDGFMVYKKFDWNEDPFYVAIKELLSATMYYDKEMNCWMDKDIC